MRQLSARCAALRDMAEHTKALSPYICAQRDFYHTRGCIRAGKAPSEVINATGQASVIENTRPVIQDGELIVGWNFGDGKYGENWLPADNEEDRAVMRQNGFDDEQISWYFANRPSAGQHMQRAPSRPPYSEQERQLAEERTVLARCIAHNHTVIGYEEVLTHGFAGLLKRVEDAAKQQGDSPFYEGCRIVLAAACTMGDHYAEEAGRLAASERDPKRKAELRQIEARCRRVPREPAETLADAAQSLWFAHILNTWEDGINANSLGRLDQILFPYYRRDIERGTLTEEEAFELICCLWVKLYRDYDVQQSCVGGCLTDGSSAVNALSWMMLDATEALGFIRCLSVRFSPETEPAFIRRALEVVGHLQKGVPFFFNDSVMIPALTAKGIALEDARDYTQIGCVETVIPGKSNPHAVTCEINLLKALEYAFGGGKSLYHPEMTPGARTGDPLLWESFDDLKRAVFAQIDELTEISCRQVTEEIIPARVWGIKPYKSVLTRGCLESGRDFNNHGALYDYYQMMFFGIPNLADSLAAMRKLVFAEKRYTLRELIAALENDFPDEAMRLDFVNKAPKYGNDDAEVDALAAEIMGYACDRMDILSEKYGLSFHAQPFTFFWMLPTGALTAASPDGRRRGESMAYSVSPMQGRDFNGLTALFNSIACLPSVKAPGTASAIVEVDPALFRDENLGYFTDMLLSAAEKGLANVQFNTITTDTLLDAQQNPEKHKNLAVRVSGFSQKFHLLDRDLQDHIISRTKHQRL